MSKSGLSSTMGSVPPGPGGHARGQDKGVYNHHNLPVVDKPADIGPGDLDLKFFDIIDSHPDANLNSPMAVMNGTNAKK